ncbi:hypothetical protein FNY66_04535 [Mediterraneibacter catenae]|uniref:MFS transporter n=1 Tax=Mediterraneibacter catenae TaxID=2594882 RepID=A0A5M9HYY2_9FIRM|nr:MULTISPECIES: hypothetical protein [Mediterraneibacter]KAA8502018.1 hypothetical protein FNY66_04535 [Mediterraneibacter catenae]MDN0043790.1 hypothetical protein [Mediterraneibacter glycyrrhizinilyticus]
MKCPICGKELELRNKQIGTNENGDPIFNEYAICRDCKKQWNLDKQRAKRAAAKKAAQAASENKDAPVKERAQTHETPVKKPAPKAETPDKKAVLEKEGTVKKAAPKKSAPSRKPASKQEAAVKKSTGKEEEQVRKPAPKRRPRPDAEDSDKPAKKPVKKRRTEDSEPAEEKRYSNIPPEKVRTKREKAARKSYGDMLETGTIDKKAVKKKKKQLEDETSEIRRNTQNKKYEAEVDEYDDDEYYDDVPRFRPMRIILGILSLAAFGYLIYRGFVTGLADTTEGGAVSSGMTFVILALCMLVSALLYFIMQKKNTVLAFILPMIFYLGAAVFAFIQRGDDLQLLIAAIAAAVLAVISLILAITSRGGGYDDEDDYDDAFEDDYADDDYDE